MQHIDCSAKKKSSLRKSFIFEDTEENESDWIQIILEWLYDMGYRNVYNYKSETDIRQTKAIKSDVVTIKYNLNQYLSFTMPKRVNDIFILTKLQNRNLSYLYYLAACGHTESIFIPLNKRINGFKVGDKFLKSDKKFMIKYVNHLCLECDGASRDIQLQLLERLKPYVTTAVFSGRRSIHIWIRTNVVTGNNPYTETDNDPPMLEPIKRYIRQICHEYDLKPKEHYDDGVLNNYATWLRLPFCKRLYHEDTYIEHHNPESKELSVSELLLENLYCYTDDEISTIDIDEYHYDYDVETEKKDDSTSILPIRVENGGTFQDEHDDVGISKHYSNIISIPDFCKNLDDYFYYMSNGLPSKGIRRLMYRDVVIAKRILCGLDYNCTLSVGESGENGNNPLQPPIREENGGTFEKYLELCLSDVSRILRISSGKYVGTFDNAINDFKEFFNASILRKNPISRLDVKSIPYPSTKADIKATQSLLESFGVAEPKNVSRILHRLILGRIRELPVNCKNGTLGMHMNNQIRKNINSKKTKAVMESLRTNNIMIKTMDSIPEHQTNKYWVNTHLVIWLTTKSNLTNGK